MSNYLFADCPFEITFGGQEKRYKDFCSAESLTPIQRISICNFDDMCGFAYGVEYLIHESTHFFRSYENPTSMMFANRDWTNINICRDINGEYSEELVVTAVYSRLCSEKTMLIHASHIDYNGKGILFIGQSGIGKTTQAELWEKYRGAKIVNGDKAFVRITDKGIYAYGTPWKGSSIYCLNEKSKIKAIVVLSQSDNNSIRRLSQIEATQMFLPHVFMPRWDEQCVSDMLETFDKVINDISVWHLTCRPDEEAVAITKKAIFDI